MVDLTPWKVEFGGHSEMFNTIKKNTSVDVQSYGENTVQIQNIYTDQA